MQNLTAARLATLSFVGLIAAGTAGFLLLPVLASGSRLSFVDALFLSTSAVCVTGLSVVDVSRELTGVGQAWLLILVQLGGLGILTLAGWIASAMGTRLGLEAHEAAQGPGFVLPPRSAARLLRTTVAFTFTLEAFGAGVLWLLWRDDFGALRAIWIALFHAVSAFCNAGFSLFTDSFVGLRDEPPIVLAIGGLVVLGGLGFPVVQDLRSRVRGQHARLTLHSRLVLASTAVLLLGSTMLYLAFEWRHALVGLSFVDRIVNAFFMAATARTAGFNTVDYDAISNASLFLTIGLMWIGGAPASVAGGVKITTVALLLCLLLSRLRGEENVSIGDRTVPKDTVQRATGLAAGALLLVGLFVFALMVAEIESTRWADRTELVRIVFEVQSAFSTVGLSMNRTPSLSEPGRLVLVPVMLLGRIGPLIVLSAMALRDRNRIPYRFAHEDVLVG
ncbi:MAG: potassium transporter Trk [Myxococcales bacterium]|nr:potassium transporter Trk [Myxococcales bacterium]